MPNGKRYPIQFKDDREWLHNTVFQTTREGKLDRRCKYCRSQPTWPNNPELQARYGATERYENPPTNLNDRMLNYDD